MKTVVAGCVNEREINRQRIPNLHFGSNFWWE